MLGMRGTLGRRAFVQLAAGGRERSLLLRHQWGALSRQFSATAVDPEGVYLTERGAERLEHLKKLKKNNDLMLRLSVEGGGCSGFSYVFDVSDKPVEKDDHVFEYHGGKLVVDDTSLQLVKGSTIDFTEDLIRRSFEVVNNPNAESGCGCGSSFSAKVEI